jgi:hypothetical protein
MAMILSSKSGLSDKLPESDNNVCTKVLDLPKVATAISDNERQLEKSIGMRASAAIKESNIPS